MIRVAEEGKFVVELIADCVVNCFLEVVVLDFEVAGAVVADLLDEVIFKGLFARVCCLIKSLVAIAWNYKVMQVIKY